MAELSSERQAQVREVEDKPKAIVVERGHVGRSDLEPEIKEFVAAGLISDTIFITTHLAIEEIQREDKLRKGMEISDNEVERVLRLMEWCPGGELRGELAEEFVAMAAAEGFEAERLIAARLKKEKSKKGKEEEVVSGARAWDLLRLADFAEERDEDGESRWLEYDEAELEQIKFKVRETHPLLYGLYFLVKTSRGEPRRIRLSDLLAKAGQSSELIAKAREAEADMDSLMASLFNRERIKRKFKKLSEVITGTRVGVDEVLARWQERSLDLKELREAVINPEKYFKERLLEAVEKRLQASRGVLEIRVKNEKEFKWLFMGPFKEKPVDYSGEERRGIFRSSRLAFQDSSYFEGSGVLAHFLQEMGRNSFWEGKRRLDVAYWAKLTGQAISATGPEGDDVFQELTKDNFQKAGIRHLTGGEALTLWSLDEGVVRALDVFSQKMHRREDEEGPWWEPFPLTRGMELLRDEGVTMEQIRDAFMIFQVLGLDIVNNTCSRDRRFVVQEFVRYYRRQAATDHRGKVHLLLSEGFGLTDSDCNKGFLYDSRNVIIAYAANSDDTRRYNPERYADQRDLIWQRVFFYLASQRWSVVGHHLLIPEREDWEDDSKEFDQEIVFPDDLVGPGRTGSFPWYDNDRTMPEINPATGKRYHIFRRALYEILRKTQTADERLTNDKTIRQVGYSGKPGWDEDGLREDVKRVLEFFEHTVAVDKKTGEKIGEIDTSYIKAKEGEVRADGKKWTKEDEECGKVLKRVLRNPSAWGIIYSLNDPDILLRSVDARRDLRAALEYDHKADSFKGILLGLLAFDIDMPFEMTDISPAKVIEAFHKLFHRFSPVQMYFQMGPALKFAMEVYLRRMAISPMEMKQIQAALSPLGDVRLGFLKAQELERAYGVHGELRDNALKRFLSELGPEAAWTALGQGALESLKFIQRITADQLMAIEEGFQDSSDGLVETFIGEYEGANILSTNFVREVVFKTQAFVHCHVGTFAKPGIMPREWQQLDVVWEKDESGKFKSEPTEVHRILVQDINPLEMAEFFYVFGRGEKDKPLPPGLLEIYQRLDLPGKAINTNKGDDSEGLYLVFKSPEHRMRFYEHKMREVYHLLYGKDKEGFLELGGPYHEVDPETGKPKKMRAKELVRQVAELYERVYVVERWRATMEIQQIYLAGREEGMSKVEMDKKVHALLQDKRVKELIREEDIPIILAEFRFKRQLERFRKNWKSDIVYYLAVKTLGQSGLNFKPIKNQTILSLAFHSLVISGLALNIELYNNWRILISEGLEKIIPDTVKYFKDATPWLWLRSILQATGPLLHTAISYLGPFWLALQVSGLGSDLLRRWLARRLLVLPREPDDKVLKRLDTFERPN